MRAPLAPLAMAVLLVGCSADDLTGPRGPELLPAPEGPTRVLINVVDGEGRPFRPDQAWWYYYTPVEGERTDEYEAVCVDAGCTQYAVTGAAAGRVYVAASYSRDHADPSCAYGGYDAMAVEVAEGAVPEVTLRLEESESCA